MFNVHNHLLLTTNIRTSHDRTPKPFQPEFKSPRIPTEDAARYQYNAFEINKKRLVLLQLDQWPRPTIPSTDPHAAAASAAIPLTSCKGVVTETPMEQI
mmetsp:Transcript_22858/g.51033  ORF Transcript_22858/g.51033 Transcript_22858/m.51033 type:complete len:99 (+) Transcript_22858:326-622(+)